MTLEKGKEAAELKKTIYRHNLIIIALLCTTTLAPAVIFYTTGPGKLKWLLVFIIISFLFSRIPKSFYDKFQLSQDIRIYKKLKVHLFKRFATNGDFINRRIRNKFPKHRNISDYGSIREKLKETYTTEKSHTVLFLFCLMISVYAFAISSLGTAIFLTAGNLIFNYYPNLLQQYNRIRYKKVIQDYYQ